MSGAPRSTVRVGRVGPVRALWEGSFVAPGAGDSAAVLLEIVSDRARQWAARIAGHLQLDSAEPITVTLHTHDRPAMSRRRHIRLPVRSGAGGVAAALAAADAGLAHELVHVIAGRSPSLLLNEGLAVHVDAALGCAGPVWPFYQLAPHRWVEAFRSRGGFVPLDDLPSALPGPGEGGPSADSRRARYYLEAGSFVGYLIDELPRSVFWDAYGRGDHLPPGWDAATAERGWLQHLGGPLTASEQRRCEASLARTAHGAGSR